jgi:hypothetical protein
MAVFEAFVGAGIRYADEPVDSSDGWQAIRPPSVILAPPRLATCVDIAVTFTSACLDAGVHPLLVLLEPVAGGPAHALVVTWLGGLWTGTGGTPSYRGFAPHAETDLVAWPGGLRSAVEGPGAFLPIDVVALAADDAAKGPTTLAGAVASGARLLSSEEWRTTAVIDVGADYDPRGALPDMHRPLSGIATYADMVAGLDGLQRNLLEGNLPYVPPGEPASPLSPSNLLTRLMVRTDEAPGVLLVGAAGVGKTRTCFEVARLAIQHGWAVLHVTSGEPAVTITEIHEAILQTRADRVLVVLDYLNECRIDLPAMRHRLLPAANRAGISLALLASCRPGWYTTTDTPIDLVFESFWLEPDADQSAQIRDRILTELAPHAIATVGLDRLRELCGLRPVIAMLIAAEAERLAAERTLATAAVGIRPGDLLHWLDRRLQEDKLVPAPVRDPFADDDGDPSLKLQACVAMLAAAPQSDNDLVSCANAVPDLPAGRAQPLLRLLRSMGWVVDGPTGTGPVHDIVTDHLVEKILLHGEPVGGVRLAATDRVLAASLHRGRTIGRYAVNLGRVLRDLPSAEPLRDHCTAWLKGHAATAGQLLADTSDEGAYALGAVLDNPAWSVVAFEFWDLLVTPWLARHSRSLAARHLLYRGLRSAPSNAKNLLAGEATTWLQEHGTLPEASFVLDPLLGRDLDQETAATAVADAMTWLQEHGTLPDAQYVLSPLLGRDLDQETAAAAHGYAMTWLQEHGTLPDAQYVLGRLLTRGDVGEIRQLIVDRAVTWTEVNGVGSDLVSKFIVRQRLITERIASLLVTWAINHPADTDVGWRLNGVAKGLNRWGDLLDGLLRAVERILWTMPPEATSLNDHSEFDGTFEYLCRSIRIGIPAAWLDDLLRIWIARPEAFSPHCSKGTHYLSLVSRVCSLLVIKDTSPPHPHVLLDRLEVWVHEWDCPEFQDLQRAAIEAIGSYRRLIQARLSLDRVR